MGRIAKPLEDLSDQIAREHNLPTMEEIRGPLPASSRVILDRISGSLDIGFSPQDPALILVTTLRDAAFRYRKEAHAYFRAARGDYQALRDLESWRGRDLVQRVAEMTRDITDRLERLERNRRLKNEGPSQRLDTEDPA